MGLSKLALFLVATDFCSIHWSGPIECFEMLQIFYFIYFDVSNLLSLYFIEICANKFSLLLVEQWIRYSTKVSTQEHWSCAKLHFLGGQASLLVFGLRARKRPGFLDVFELSLRFLSFLGLSWRTCKLYWASSIF